MELNIQKQISLFIICFLATIILWYVLLYLPKKNDLKRIKDEIKLFQTQYELLSQKKSSVTFEKTEEKAVFLKYNELIKRLPQKEEISFVLSQIKEIGQEKNIEINSLKLLELQLFKNPVNNEEFQVEEIPVSIFVQGSFLNIMQYLLHLDKLHFIGGYKNIHMETYEKIYPEIKVQLICILLLLNRINK